MPTLHYLQDVQRRAKRKQRPRLRRFRRLRAVVRKARSNIRRREGAIDRLQGPKVDGNKVTGGAARERLVAGARAAADLHARGVRKSFYSQPGAWTVKYGITGEPRGYRSDCSQWVTSIYWSAGLADPNGEDYEGGYTGTLGTHGRKVTNPKPGDLGFYGSWPHHHVEMYVGDGKMIGHGSPAVDSVTPGWPDSWRSYVK